MATQPDARSRPTAWAVSNWWDDPWARGAWSLLRVGASADTRRTLGEPIDGRLILVGEATHPAQAGMTHGAWDEGRRAAAWALAEGHRKVIVVGAGAAGLGAARVLHDAGVNVIVVEARDRIGGRINSVPVGETVVELGANWLQQRAANGLAGIAEQLGLTLVATDFNTPADYDVEARADADERVGRAAQRPRVAHESIADQLTTRVDDLEEDRSLGQVLDAWLDDLGADGPVTMAEEIERFFRSEIYLDAGAPLDDLSALHGFEPGVGEGDRWVLGGYRQILDHLAAGLDIRFSTPVTRIERDGVGVAVDCGVTSHIADSVVVTVPAAVLRTEAVEFLPPLPSSHRRALDRLTVGRVEKVALQFTERWWPTDANGYLRTFGLASGSEIAEWLDVTDHVGTPMIVGLFVGDWVARLWDDHSDDEIAHAAADALRRATGIA